MQIIIWGTRGSTPVSGPRFARYGGNTPCVEARSARGNAVILDAGTGIGALARSAPSPQENAPVICLTHLHLDHIQGLPFYTPLYQGKTVVYGPKGTKEQLKKLFDGAFHPVPLEKLPDLEIREIEPGTRFTIGDMGIETCAANHPGGALAYKITADGSSLVFSGDHEIPLGDDPEAQRLNSGLLKFMAGSDVAIVDGQFSQPDHVACIGWGHSHPEQWAEALQNLNVGRILFTHFSPAYDDSRIDGLIQAVRQAWPGLKLDAAFDGCVIENGEIAARQDPGSCPICDFFKRTAALSDTHAVLEAILTEARKQGKADAGSVYLVQDNELAFSAAQNDTLFPDSAANKFFYMNARIPVNKSSIAGYVAATGESLNIPDVHALPPNSEYGFNIAFDKQSGYRTKSVLAVPLLNARGAVTGVLQLINSLDQGEPAPFTQQMKNNVSSLAAMATVPLERSFLLTSMVMRILQTAALNDPSETAGHVYRVGALAAELYHRWAEKHDVEPEELLATKGVLRLAAMLHDVGKVGIPDAVLKKPGRLDANERAIMERHAALGAKLFESEENGIIKIAREIALHHHAKWDGSGYSGDAGIISPAGQDIPLFARITSIADVYDAIVSRRCYKEPHASSEALDILQKDAGSHFDPELVQVFMEIRETVEAIMERYK